MLKRVNLLHKLIAGIFILLLLCMLPCLSEKSGRCDICKEFVNNFNKGLDTTARSNFGGGNTNWEEKYLGKYLKSETRFVEILEGACGDTDKRECHQMIEENEESLENWWFHRYIKDLDQDLFAYFCDQTLKVCCPNGTYGHNCLDCPGGRVNPCSGRGDCVGDGQRNGKGTCSCNGGYRGDLCDECSNKYFSQVEDGKAECIACHKSCKMSCMSSSSSDCDDCNYGWSFVEGQGCVDVDECSEGEFNCSENQFCSNSEGNYRCVDCNKACLGCHGGGRDRCVSCASKHFKSESLCIACHPSCANSCTDEFANSCDACGDGWRLDEETRECIDKSECEDANHNCNSQSQYCSNTPGSFHCLSCYKTCTGCSGPNANQCLGCKAGYELVGDGTCQDVDECSIVVNCNDGENEKCVNMVGSFKCECKDGYVRRMGSTCFKKNIVIKKIKSKTAGDTRPANGEKIPVKKPRPSFEDFNVVPGPGGFKAEDIKRLGDPKEASEQKIVMEGTAKTKIKKEL